jgi:hypothetical protein
MLPFTFQVKFKNYLNHYLKRSDHFLGTLKFLHTVSVSSSDSLVIGFRCMFYKWDQLFTRHQLFFHANYTLFLQSILQLHVNVLFRNYKMDENSRPSKQARLDTFLIPCTIYQCVFLLIFTWKVKGNIFGYLYTNQTYIFFFIWSEQILCHGTFILFISTNGCLYNFFTHF